MNIKTGDKMELTLHTEGWFDASHHLENYEGKCANSHGHTFFTEIWIKGSSTQLNKSGILWDFGNLKKLLEEVDHKDLNDFMKSSDDEFRDVNPTAENLCLIFYNILSNSDSHLKFKVRIYEQIAPKKSYCECGDF